MLTRLQHWLRFNVWYLGHPPWDTGITPPELTRFCACHDPGRAFDIGCGTGTNLLYLARHGWRVGGADLAVKAVRTARRRLAQEHFNADVRCIDVTRSAELGQGYDLVLDIGCLHGLPSEGQQAYLAGLPGLLAGGGAYLLYTHLREKGEAKAGLDEDQIAALCQVLPLVWRENSLDRRGRKAAWLECRREG